MSLHTRLDALARIAREEGYLGDAEPCRSCGWPRPRAPRFVVLPVDNEREPSKCPVCGNLVDDAGLAIAGARTTVVLESLCLELGPSTPQSFALRSEQESYLPLARVGGGRE